ncbi:CHAT domain-containing protein [Streptomyces sp. NPDC088760]|uniref:CHAT domain-containing protein n=1 Tax=Streptomyces sp. NPDC088760 TaxID=3365890 RepID=UPI00381C4F9B
MRDRLLHSLGDRLRKADQGDVMCVLEQEALLDAVQLLAMAVDETGTAADYCCDVETAHTLGRLHWYRCRLLPAVFRHTDHERASALFAGLERIAPPLVPAALRDEIATYAGPVVPVVTDHVHLARRAARIQDTEGDLAEAADLLRAAAAAAPAESRDQGLVLSNLCGVLRDDDAEFAFPSACKTALGAGDEGINLVNAMHLDGYRHVIGTLWSVPDPVMGRLVKDFHHRSSSDGGFRPDTSARALHGAVQSLRHRFPENPSRRAPFVHTGP